MLINRPLVVSCILLAVASLPLLLAAEPPATGRAQRLQLRLVVDDAAVAGGAVVDELPEASDAGGASRLHVLREAIVDASEISGVHLENTQGVNDTTIIMEMTPKGAQRLGDATESNAGRRLAVVLDGKVIVAPTIMGRISNRVAISQASPNPEQLLRLAQRMNDVVATPVVMNIPTTSPTTAPVLPSTRP